MLTVHHLNQSRSQRVLWALEELQLPYQIVRYQREKTMLAPAALKLQYRFWLHYAEGSLMPLLLMKLVFASLGKPPVPFGVRSLGSLLGKGIQKTWLDPQLATHARFIDDHLAARPWFAGERLSMADIQMSFPVMALLARGGMHDLVHIEAWRQRVEQRPAWQRAIERGGPFTLPGA